MPIDFDPVNKYILITSPTTTVEAITIYSQTMDWCDNSSGIVHNVPMIAGGKFDMGGGTYSDILFQLQNGWKLKFWSVSEHFKVTGTFLPETPTESRHITPADVEYQVATQGTIVETGSGVTETDKDDIRDRILSDATKFAGADIGSIKTKTTNLPSDPASNTTVNTKASQTSVDDLQLVLDRIDELGMGRWKIENNQFIMYKTDGITELKRFNLYDKDGKPTMETAAKVRERVPV